MVSLDDIVVDVLAICYCMSRLAEFDRTEHSKENHAIPRLRMPASKTARNADETEQLDQ